MFSPGARKMTLVWIRSAGNTDITSLTAAHFFVCLLYHLEGQAGRFPYCLCLTAFSVAGKSSLPGEHLRKPRSLPPQRHPETVGSAVEGSALGICTNVLCFAVPMLLLVEMNQQWTKNCKYSPSSFHPGWPVFRSGKSHRHHKIWNNVIVKMVFSM